MVIQVNAQEGEHFLSSFAHMVGSTVENGRVMIPAPYGNGYVQGFLYGNQLRLIVRHYTLNEGVVVRRRDSALPSSMVLLSFQNILPDTVTKPEPRAALRRPLPSVTISTQGLEAEVAIPSRIAFNAINLGIDATYLRQLVGLPIENTVLKTILDNRQPLVFEQLVSTKLQEVASEIVGSLVAAPLQTLFYKVKSVELIYYLFTELIGRQTSHVQALNRLDVNRLYAVRDQLIHNLARAPSLNELATDAGMSKSKLKRLFTQIFGNSVYQYYQTVRMNEAAFLLNQKQQSVAEVGFALGFCNLSHFARVFEAHTGIKPKKFSTLP